MVRVGTQWRRWMRNGADYLVTGNKKHFPNSYKNTRLVDAREFLDLIDRPWVPKLPAIDVATCDIKPRACPALAPNQNSALRCNICFRRFSSHQSLLDNFDLEHRQPERCRNCGKLLQPHESHYYRCQ